MKRVIMILFAFTLLASALFVGCDGILVGSGNLEAKEYPLSDFSKIEISSAFEFDIQQSNSYSINVTADDNIIEKVRVIKEGNTLKIDLETFPRIGPMTLKVAITLPQLTDLDVSGATRGTISDFNSSGDLDITVSGASKVAGDITAGDVDFDVSGASTLQLEGSADDIDVDVSGASRLYLGGFTVKNTDITVSGASRGTINMSGKLDADISGASKLEYIGEPTMGSINSSGASSLSSK